MKHKQMSLLKKKFFFSCQLDSYSDVFNPKKAEEQEQVACNLCGLEFNCRKDAKEHHFSKHYLTPYLDKTEHPYIWNSPILIEGLNNRSGHIDRIFQIRNLPETSLNFEEYRKQVIAKVDPKSIVAQRTPGFFEDGNELIVYYRTTVECSLGGGGGSSLTPPTPCTSPTCGLCRVLRHGFSTNDNPRGCVAYLTSACFCYFDNVSSSKWAFIVCKAILGKVYRPKDYFQNNLPKGPEVSWFNSILRVFGDGQNYVRYEIYFPDAKALLPLLVYTLKF